MMRLVEDSLCSPCRLLPASRSGWQRHRALRCSDKRFPCHLKQPLRPHVSRDRATWLAYLFVLYYAYMLNILGPLTPFLRSEMTLTYTLASLHFSAFAAGMLLAGITADRVAARYGRRTTLWVGALGMAGGTLVLLVGHQPLVTVAACFLMGWVGSWILAVYPAVLAERHDSRVGIAVTEANIFGSTGAAAGPFVLGIVARTAVGWRAALLLPALALPLLFVVYRTEPLTPAPRAVPAEPSARPRRRRLPGAFWASWAVLVTVVSIEFCTIYWSADFLQGARGMAPADAALAVTLFLAAMLAGRIAGSQLLRRMPAKSLLFVSLAVTGAGFLVFWLGRAAPASAVGLVVAGLGVANLYPITLSLAMESAPQQLDQASARASLASGTAIIALPLLLGRIADRVGIARGPSASSAS